MIVDIDRKWVFVSTPKCATNTMYAVLPQYNGQRVGGFHQRDKGILVNTFSFTICRNPYDRAVSIWWSTCHPHEKEYKSKRDYRAYLKDPTNFEEFILWFISHKGPFISQTGWLKGLNINRYLRMEDLKKEFLTLPFINKPPKEWPIENQTRNIRKHYSEYMTPKAIAAVQKWAVGDFEKLGYSLEVENE